MSNILDLVLQNLDKVIVGSGAAVVAFLVKKFLGPKLLARFIKTKDRAAMLEDGAEFVVKHLTGIIQATPNKYDDLGLELLKAIEQWAEAKRIELSLLERTDIALSAREKLMSRLALDVALSPARVAGVDLSGMKVK